MQSNANDLSVYCILYTTILILLIFLFNVYLSNAGRYCSGQAVVSFM